jgi:two-component system response regulator ResD
MARRLLVIDDEEWITVAIKRVAESLQFETRLVTDSRRAVDAFIEFEPDVVLLDLHMPDRDGLYVLNDLLTASNTTNVIIISGGGEDALKLGDTVAKLHDAKRVTFLPKPFKRAELVRRLSEVSVADRPGSEAPSSTE